LFLLSTLLLHSLSFSLTFIFFSSAVVLILLVLLLVVAGGDRVGVSPSWGWNT
jgi:hypothetical protein